MQQQQNNNTYRTRINHFIRVPQVRVILNDGSTAGVMETFEALKLAKEQGLDLVEINPRSSPPVVKICDYGKYCYDLKKSASASKKNQKVSELKEISFRPTTEENDLNHKLAFAKEFLTDGHKVKFVVRFRGREITHTQLGKDKLEWVLTQIAPLINSSSPITMDGKLMITTVTPKVTL